MKEFNYEKYGEEYERGLDWIIDVVAESANPEKFEEKIYLGAYVNDYVESQFDYLTRDERNLIYEEIIKEYYLL